MTGRASQTSPGIFGFCRIQGRPFVPLKPAETLAFLPTATGGRPKRHSCARLKVFSSFLPYRWPDKRVPFTTSRARVTLGTLLENGSNSNSLRNRLAENHSAQLVTFGTRTIPRQPMAGNQHLAPRRGDDA